MGRKPLEKGILEEILDLHIMFQQAWDSFQKFYKKEQRPSYKKEDGGYFIAELDTKSYEVTLFFVMENEVYRQGSVKTHLAFFFPITNQDTGQLIVEGIKMETLMNINWKESIFSFSSHNGLRSIYSLKLYNQTQNSLNIKDDWGKVMSRFPDVEILSPVVKMPSKLMCEYEIVDMDLYAPYTTNKDFDCVLFAEKENSEDKCAIKVFRWSPQVRNNNGSFASKGNVFFSLGYISKSQSSDLHRYMYKNHCRILFGRKSNNRIKILGGLETLRLGNIYYPSCLITIPVHE